MRDRDLIVLALIVLLALVAVWIALPIDHPSWAKQALVWQQYPDMNLKEGLDIQGGTQILLQASPAAGQTVGPDDMTAAKSIVQRRVNGLGVSEPLVQLQGTNRIIVALPGISNPDAAVQTIKSTGQLEFVEIGSSSNPEYPNVVQGSYIRTTNNPAGPTEGQAKVDDPYADHVFTTVMTGRDLQNASTQLDQYGAATIGFQLTDQGAKIFGDYTSQHVDDVVAIVLDNVVLSAPRIQTPITDGAGQITGQFTREEADSLSIQMRYGALPVSLDVMDRRTIAATLGSDSVRRSVVAGVIGLIVVMIFMVAQYRLPGVLAAVALLIYAVINLALYKLIPITVTLPGIAGFVLSIGMAVDANVLIFERMKEELRWGRSLEYAVDTAFHRAWPAIRDSNISTILTCFVLIFFGSTFGAQAVMGFALTLLIGVLVSMFTAVTVTRTFMRLVFHGERIESIRSNRMLLDY